MISSPFVAVLLSILFMVTGGYALFRTVVSSNVRDRISYVTHIVMSVAMFCMIWPWGDELFLLPQIVVFAAATVWFLVLASSPACASGHLSSGHHDSRGKLLYHAGMMAAMVVMAFGMIGMNAGMTSSSGAVDMGSMPGMDMSSMGGGMVSPLWVNVVSLVLAVCFGVAALYFVGSTLASATSPERSSRPVRSRTADAAWNLLMAVGMGALFVSMIALG